MRGKVIFIIQLGSSSERWACPGISLIQNNFIMLMTYVSKPRIPHTTLGGKKSGE